MAKKGISAHFRNEAIIMVGFLLVIPLIAMLAGFFEPKIIFSKIKAEINQCVKTGGTYAAENGQCERRKSLQ